jgi:hypothetical protein
MVSGRALEQGRVTSMFLVAGYFDLGHLGEVSLPTPFPLYLVISWGRHSDTTNTLCMSDFAGLLQVPTGKSSGKVLRGVSDPRFLLCL